MIVGRPIVQSRTSGVTKVAVTRLGNGCCHPIFSSKNWRTFFLVIVLKSWYLFLTHRHHPHPFPAFHQGVILSLQYPLWNSATDILYFHQGVTPSTVSPEAVRRPPLPPQWRHHRKGQNSDFSSFRPICQQWMMPSAGEGIAGDTLFKTCFDFRHFGFLPRFMQCRRGLAMRILFVRPSVCQMRDLWQNGRKICADFYIPYERSFSLVILWYRATD